jgi:hypothetical protein
MKHQGCWPFGWWAALFRGLGWNSPPRSNKEVQPERKKQDSRSCDIAYCGSSTFHFHNGREIIDIDRLLSD